MFLICALIGDIPLSESVFSQDQNATSGKIDSNYKIMRNIYSFYAIMQYHLLSVV